MRKKICILCGGPTKFDFQDLCDTCLALPIEEIPLKYLKKARESICEPCQPKSLYHRLMDWILGGKS